VLALDSTRVKRPSPKLIDNSNDDGASNRFEGPVRAGAQSLAACRSAVTLRRASNTDDGQVLASSLELYIQFQLDASFALDQGPWLRVRRTVRPAVAWFESRLAVRRITIEVNLIRHADSQRHVRSTCHKWFGYLAVITRCFVATAESLTGGFGCGFSLSARPMVVVPKCKPALGAIFSVPIVGQRVLSRCTA
jgi:hypothetical protein